MSHAAPPPTFTRLTEMDDAWATSAPGARLDAIRRQGLRLRERIGASGTAVAVRTYPIVTFPYPTAYGLGGAAKSRLPFVMMRNRMHIVQLEQQGRLVNILVNPSDPERALAAPFFATQLDRYGDFIGRRVMSKRHGSVELALRDAGLAPEEVHYITFDHLHVQDLRGWLGTEEPEDGFESPTRALLPRAKLLAQRAELETMARPHPLQRFWYVADGLASIPADKIVALDGDYLLGGGMALVRTPGHTRGNHSIVLGTDSGLWTISENGIAVDCYAPEHSRIAGLAQHARTAGVEVILNGNTRENTLDQYTSMVLEKTLADPCPDQPQLPQHFPSSELVKSRLAPGLAPTFSQRRITHGALRTNGAARGASSAA